ncbi:unnamed protein product [Heligmosomoides polygyrus]|uniref:Neurogenic protein mastermind n=1 Tax=Heligmosomoides polygyrus TaxID=6339 RepID=A0A3P8C3E2_HELPZ|nr:unnamed protein product [Heligmosomoides polygyrus]
MVSLEEAEQFMTSVLELDENTITLNDAINMANAAEKNSTWKKRKLAMMFDTELKRRKHDETVRGVPAPTHLPADSVVMQRRKYKAKYRKSGEAPTMMPKLIPPSEISLGPSGPNECSDSGDVTNVHSQRVECLSPPSVQQTCGESSLVQSEEADSVFTVPPLDEEQLHSFFQNTFSTCFGQLSQMQPRQWNCLYPCTDSVEDAGMSGEQTSNSTQTSIPDLVEFYEGQPAEDEQNALFESMAAIEPNESDYLEFPKNCNANLQLPMDCNANLQFPKNCNANLQLPIDCNANLQLPKNCNANLQLPMDCNANLQLPKNCNTNPQFQKNCNAILQLSMDRNANLQLPKNFNANLQFPVNCNANIYNNAYPVCVAAPENYYRTSVDSAAAVGPADDLDSLSLSSLTDLFERDAEPLDIFNSNEFIDPF